MGSFATASQAPPRENCAAPLSGYSRGFDAKALPASDTAAPLARAASRVRAAKACLIRGASEVDVDHVRRQYLNRGAEDLRAEERVVEAVGRVDANQERVRARDPVRSEARQDAVMELELVRVRAVHLLAV